MKVVFTIFIESSDKIFSFVVLHKLAKFHYQTVFTKLISKLQNEYIHIFVLTNELINACKKNYFRLAAGIYYSKKFIKKTPTPSLIL